MPPCKIVSNHGRKNFLEQALSLQASHLPPPRYQLCRYLLQSSKRCHLISNRPDENDSCIIHPDTLPTPLLIEVLASYNQQSMAYQSSLLKSLFLISVMVFAMLPNAIARQETMERLEGLFHTIFGGYCPTYDSSYRNSVEFVASLEETGHFNASQSPLLRNPYNITNVTFEKVYAKNSWFDFPNRQENSYRTISGLISLPATKTIKGVVLYFFPTTFDKSSPPSADKNKFYKLIGGLYASQNYAVVFSDHLGMGNDSAHVHPYLLYPQQQAKAGIFLLNEVLSTLNKNYGNHTKSNPWPLMTAGYSDGANYAVWFSLCSLKQSRIFYPYCTSFVDLDETYKIVGVAGMNGAYDLSNTLSQYLFTPISTEKDNNKFHLLDQISVNIAKPALASLLVTAFSRYSKSPFNLTTAFIPSYHALNCSGNDNFQSYCNIREEHINISEAFTRSFLPNAFFARALSYGAFDKQNDDVHYSSLWDSPFSEENNVFAFINKAVVDGGDFYQTLDDAGISGYGNKSPHKIFIFSLKNNSVISPQNSFKFSSNNASGNVYSYTFDNSKYRICVGWQAQPVDHLQAELLANIFSVNFFNTKLGL